MSGLERTQNPVRFSWSRCRPRDQATWAPTARYAGIPVVELCRKRVLLQHFDDLLLAEPVPCAFVRLLSGRFRG
jgi:hypothetical protein